MPCFPQLQSEADDALPALAARLPAAVKATVLAASLPDAMHEAIGRFHPLLASWPAAFSVVHVRYRANWAERPGVSRRSAGS